MREPERVLFKTWLTGVETFLEFGAGGSTSFAAVNGVSRIFSVESDIKLLQILADRPELKVIEFNQVYIDIGPVGSFGTPTDPATAVRWPEYYRTVWEKLDVAPDLVLVDGRFRVACALSTILHCKAEMPIVIHDFWDRTSYHVLLKYLEPMDRCETLGIFRAKPDLNFGALAIDLSGYALDVR